MDKHGGREINPQTEKDQSIRVAGTVIRRVFLFIIQTWERVVQSELAFGEKQREENRQSCRINRNMFYSVENTGRS